jgi:hypothetical protein
MLRAVSSALNLVQEGATGAGQVIKVTEAQARGRKTQVACESVAFSWAVPFIDVFRPMIPIISPHKSLDGRCSSTFRATSMIILSRDRRKMPQQTPDYDLLSLRL